MFEKIEPQPRIRLDYLDGLRGVAALYVSIFHATLTTTWAGSYNYFPIDLPDSVALPMQPFLYGRYAVVVFIILSGYCLMIPVVKQPAGLMPGGLLEFWRRRIRRILPPYYAAIVLSLLLALLPGMDHLTGARWDQALPAWKLGPVLSHLFLVQNWSRAWLFKINMPSWTVATEWQIYFLFSFVLLPLSRRMGLFATTLLAFWAGQEVHLYFRGEYDFIFWSYLGLFALGMLGAAISFSPEPWARFSRERLPWGVFTVLIWVGLCRMLLSLGRRWLEDNCWLTDPLVGLGTLCLMLFCTQALATRPLAAPLIVRLFQWKPLVQLGVISYSYYLLHDPILCLARLALQQFELGYTLSWYLMLGIAIPLCVACAYLFHLVFERPFMRGHPRTAKQAALAAVVSPAP